MHEAYSDVDWARCTDTRQCTTGMLITVNNTLLSWKSERQSLATLSSAEAKYVVLSTTCKELSWLRSFQREVASILFESNGTLSTTDVYTDNTAALSLARNGIVIVKTKSIK